MKFNRPLLLLPLVALLVSCAGTKNSAKTSNAAGPDPALNTENSLLWQVYGNGLKTPSYLYGTIHAIPNDDFFMGKNVEKKFDQAKLLIMEVDLAKADVSKLALLSLLPDEKTVKDYVSDSDYTVIQRFLADSVGITKFAFESAYGRFKPFFLEQFVYFQELGPDRTAYETIFQDMAERQGKGIEGLETLEEQLGFIDTIPLDMQFEGLVDAIRNYGSERYKLRQLIEDYKKQNLSAFEKALLEEQPEDAAFYTDLLLDRRNTAWVPKLALWMQEQPCFIAVGAGHLGGEKGLVSLLRQKGYTVEAISIH